jgi:hypothetical protein
MASDGLGLPLIATHELFDLDLAPQMELKTFLAHRHCQSLMDLRWRGGFPVLTSRPLMASDSL